MKKLLKVVAALLVLFVVVGGFTFVWARMTNGKKLSQRVETHRSDFPIPYPLSDEEAAAAVAMAGGDDVDLDALALARAVERGDHLVHARYGCVECHGENFGGGVMIDDPMIGSLLGPNITAGSGGKTATYTSADWDRIVRHGVKPDGTPATMPSFDFKAMSDEELSDIIAYVRSLPTVDATIAPPKLGPLGTMLLAFGALPLAAVDEITDHQSAHLARPPVADATVEFGQHLSGICSGCHGAAFAGGPIPGAPPGWLPAANLTSHADGLGGWTADQFLATMRTGQRPDGTALGEPMTLMIPYSSRMTDTELQALFLYLRSLPPVAGN